MKQKNIFGFCILAILLILSLTSVYGKDAKINLFDGSKDISKNMFVSSDVVAVDTAKIGKLEKNFKGDVATLEFSCNSPVIEIFKHPDFINDKNKIINEGKPYAFSYCVDGVARVNVDSFSSYASINSALVHYYNFSANANDYFGTKNGTVSGATNVVGKFGNGYSFDGSNDYISLPSGILNNATEYSFVWYQKPSIITGSRATLRFLADVYSDVFFNDQSAGLCVESYGGTWQYVCDANPTVDVWAQYGYSYNPVTNAMKLYKDGVSISNSSGAMYSSTGTNKIGDASNDYAGLIDEYFIFNRVLTSDEMSLMYALTEEYPFPPDSAPISFDFVSQTPADISIANIIQPIEIIYNISNANETLPVYLNYTIGGGSDCSVFIGGVCTINGGEYQSVLFDYLSGNRWNTTLYENLFIPATYNLDEEYMESATKSVRSATSTINYLKVKFTNVSASSEYMYLEGNLNSSVANIDADVFYCNSAYSSGNPTVSANCVSAGTFFNVSSSDHCHAGGSCHDIFTVPISSGEINGLSVSATSYFLLRPHVGETFTLAYVSNNSDTFSYSTNFGITYTNISGTADMHLHQFTGNESLSYLACGTGTDGILNCSDARSDSIEYPPLTETPPIVILTNPVSASIYTITDPLLITWTGFDANGDAINYILYINDFEVYSGQNTNYSADLSAYSGTTTIRIIGTDDSPLTYSDEDSVVISVSTTSTATANFNFTFSWDINNSFPAPLGCPTNFMQFLLLMFFFGIAGTICFVSAVIRQPMYMLYSGGLWILTSTFLFGCNFLMSLGVAFVGVMMCIYALNIKAY